MYDPKTGKVFYSEGNDIGELQPEYELRNPKNKKK